MQIDSAELRDIQAPTITREASTFWGNDGYVHTLPGLKCMGPFQLNFIARNREPEMLAQWISGDKSPFTLALPDGQEWKFEGFVRTVSPGSDGMNVEIQPTGPFTVTTKKERQLMKVRNRFYVAAAKVTTEREQSQDNVTTPDVWHDGAKNYSGNWTCKTLKGAIAHAEKLLAENPGQDHAAIVQIIRVVRRKHAPVVVEVVR